MHTELKHTQVDDANQQPAERVNCFSLSLADFQVINVVLLLLLLLLSSVLAQSNGAELLLACVG